MISRGVERTLSDPGAEPRLPTGRLRVWVRFSDKGLDGTGAGEKSMSRALARAESELGSRSRIRRAKMAGEGKAELVDFTDLPIHAPYTRAVAGTGALMRRESRWLNAVSCDATPRQVALISELPGVAEITLVRQRARPGEITGSAAGSAANAEPGAASAATRTVVTETYDYGSSLSELQQINVPAVHELGITGAGVLIGMLDSGFKTTHQALADVDVFDKWDFVNADPIVENEVDDPWDAHSHGTMTLSTIGGRWEGRLVGVAPDAGFVLAKTEETGSESAIEEDNWVAGIEWLESVGVDIVNSSLGYRDWYDFSDLDGNTAACTIAADLAVGKGVIVVNSAGNDRDNDWGHILAPADGDSVIAVGAVDEAGAISSFSSPGPSADGRIKPDIAARGVRNYVVNPFDDLGYLYVSGTSFSCPQTTGVIALILSRLPGLTPIQIREALRQTADHAGAPDNDYGWGIIDALAALRYFGARFDHDPLPDTENTAGPYVVAAEITSYLGLASGGIQLHYRTDGGSWQQTVMLPAEGDLHTAEMPGAVNGSTIDYYLSAADDSGNISAWPESAPADYFSFAVGPDLTPPLLAHEPLWDQPRFLWPATVTVNASDNLGLDIVEAVYSVNGGEQGSFDLSPLGDGVFASSFPIEADWIAAGSVVEYSVRAVDAAAAANSTELGPFSLSVVAQRGTVLVIDDTGSYGDCVLGRLLAEAGFRTRIVESPDLVPEDFADLHFVALASGNNPYPASVPAVRYLLGLWTADGGRLLAEGGELGHWAFTTNGYLDFIFDVLHINSWFFDEPGVMVAAADAEDHPLLNHPHALGDSLFFADTAEPADIDVVSAGLGAYAVLVPTAFQDYGAMIVVHDAEDPGSGPQTVTFSFNLDALAESVVARKLVENAAEYLMTASAATGVGPPPRSARLLPNVPNPFNPRTEIIFRTGLRGRVELDIYDTRGRRVACLVDAEELDAGEHSITWNGTDDRGRRVASGVYLVRLITGDQAAQRKVLLAR